jgi:hypothetical protein
MEQVYIYMYTIYVYVYLHKIKQGWIGNKQLYNIFLSHLIK